MLGLEGFLRLAISWNKEEVGGGLFLLSNCHHSPYGEARGGCHQGSFLSRDLDQKAWPGSQKTWILGPVGH